MTDLYLELLKANIDYKFFLERYGDNSTYERMLFGFLQDTTFGKLVASYEVDDKKEVVIYATSLLGTAQYLGFKDFCEILKPVSDIYLTNDDAQWKDFIDRCQKEYDRIKSVVEPFSK